VAKKGFPDTQFKFMEKINNEHTGDIDVKAKFINKCILEQIWIINEQSKVDLYLPRSEQKTLL